MPPCAHTGCPVSSAVAGKPTNTMDQPSQGHGGAISWPGTNCRRAASKTAASTGASRRKAQGSLEPELPHPGSCPRGSSRLLRFYSNSRFLLLVLGSSPHPGAPGAPGNTGAHPRSTRALVFLPGPCRRHPPRPRCSHRARPLQGQPRGTPPAPHSGVLGFHAGRGRGHGGARAHTRTLDSGSGCLSEGLFLSGFRQGWPRRRAPGVS